MVFVSIMVSFYFTMMYFYNTQEKNRKVFESLSITFQSKPTIEYGSKDYDVEKFVKDSSGDVKITSGNVDSMHVGTHEVALQVIKKGIQRNFSFKVEVRDTKPPEIKIKDDFISLMVGDDFNPSSNILLVHDFVDGDLNYVDSENVFHNQRNYYTYETNFNPSVAGEYSVNIRAVDKHNNVSSRVFFIRVEEPIIEDTVEDTSSISTMDVSKLNVTTTNGSKGEIVQLAQSLLGHPYVAGGNSPLGFDCSGFVSYVFGINGIFIPRTTGGQFSMGVGVPIEEALPGDVLVFGSYSSVPTHTAIYIGGGDMIHAANPRKGVIVSNVSMYVSYGNSVLSVRRI